MDGHPFGRESIRNKASNDEASASVCPPVRPVSTVAPGVGGRRRRLGREKCKKWPRPRPQTPNLDVLVRSCEKSSSNIGRWCGSIHRCNLCDQQNLTAQCPRLVASSSAALEKEESRIGGKRKETEGRKRYRCGRGGGAI